MKKTLKRKLIGLIASITLIVACLSYCLVEFLGSKTFGWFSGNENVSTTGIQLRSEISDFDLDYRLYKKETNHFKGTDKDEEGNLFTLDDFKLLSYDTIFKARNTNTPVLFRFIISGDTVNKEAGSVKITIERNAEEDSELTKLDEFFSSVIDFSFGIDKNIYELDEHQQYDADIIYTNGYETFMDELSTFEKKSFVKKNSETSYTKYKSISFDLEYEASDWNDDVLNAYLFVTYNDDLIKNYFSNYTQEIQSLAGNEVTFSNDLSLIAISYAGGSK